MHYALCANLEYMTIEIRTEAKHGKQSAEPPLSSMDIWLAAVICMLILFHIHKFN